MIIFITTNCLPLSPDLINHRPALKFSSLKLASALKTVPDDAFPIVLAFVFYRFYFSISSQANFLFGDFNGSSMPYDKWGSNSRQQLVVMPCNHEVFRTS